MKSGKGSIRCGASSGYSLSWMHPAGYSLSQKMDRYARLPSSHVRPGPARHGVKLQRMRAFAAEASFLLDFRDHLLHDITILVRHHDLDRPIIVVFVQPDFSAFDPGIM